MDSNIAIKVENVSKTFKIPHEKISSLRGAFVGMFKKKSYEEFQALDNISFEVKKGEFFGIIGRNGSGKSTLLKILAGIYQADKGRVHIDGLISPFLELGIGFNPELSGRDNVYLNATVLGMSKKQIDAKFNDIVAFSELERFIDQKLKNYSSGMQVRLAFSVAIHANRDILLMDEVLAVGDTNFQSKCLTEFNRYKDLGKTVILVTHDISTVQRYCDRAMLLRNGKIMKIGKAEEVGNAYIYENMSDEEKRINDDEKQTLIQAEEDLKKLKGKEFEEERKRIERERMKHYEEKKNRVAEITRVELVDKKGKIKTVFKTGEELKIKIYFKKYLRLKKINIGVSVQTEDDIYLFGYNTEMDNILIGESATDITLIFQNTSLLKGAYKINIGCFDFDGGSMFDHKQDFIRFEIFSFGTAGRYKGILNVEHIWNVKKT